MLHNIRAIFLAAGMLIAAVSMAQSPAPDAPPAGSTGLCKDGAYWQGPTKQGACRGHHGVKDWYGTAATASTPAPAAAVTPAAAAPAPASAPAVAPAPAAAAPAVRPVAPVAAAPAVTAAPGGGAGQVWGNKTSKVYHCSTDRWYGKTKNGEYLTEAEAVAQGYRPDHGKACH